MFVDGMSKQATDISLQIPKLNSVSLSEVQCKPTDRHR